MIVPEFRLSQTDNHVVVKIRLPYVKISRAQFYIEENEFKTYLKPYLLKINMEQKLKLAQDPQKAVYDSDKHLLEVWLLKDKPGEEFTNLDVITKLLSKDKKSGLPKTNLIQELGETSASVQTQTTKINPFSYGFNNNYTGIFNNFQEQASQLFSCNPQETPVEDRLAFSRSQAKSDFQLQHYIYDMTQNQQIQSILHPLPLKELASMSLDQPLAPQSFIQVLKLPKKSLLISPQLLTPTLYQICDIMFCYFYQLRCMNGELSVESAITINETSSVLSNNINYQNLDAKGMLIECFRRCLTYSLYSHWELCQQVLSELKRHLSRHGILRGLLQVKKALAKSDPRHLLNRIYIDDFCAFVQRLDGETLTNLSKEVQQVKIGRQEVQLNLPQ